MISDLTLHFHKIEGIRHRALIAIVLMATCTFSTLGCSSSDDQKVEKIVFGSDRDGTYKLYLMNPDGTDQQVVSQYGAGEPSLAIDGRIVFSGSGGIFTSNISGGDLVQLTYEINNPHCADWSPDGNRILFTSGLGNDAEIYLMNSDGSGLVNITNSPEYDGFPGWSPDGIRLFFKSTRNNIKGLFIMNLDGTGIINLTENSSEGSGDWAPNGTRIVFSRRVESGDRKIHVIKFDGTELEILDHPGDCWSPVWSPNGKRFAFTRTLDEERDIVVINRDGSGAIVLTDSGYRDSDPDWERITIVSTGAGGRVLGPGGL